MGYYDFNDHFWSPLEVCAQAPKKEPQERKIKVTKIMQVLFIAMSHPSPNGVKKVNGIIN